MTAPAAKEPLNLACQSQPFFESTKSKGPGPDEMKQSRLTREQPRILLR